MTTQQFTAAYRGLTFSLVILAAGLSLSALTAYANRSSNQGVFTSATTQCHDSEDILAALDRSRNGISLSCNSDTVAIAVAQ